MLVFLLNRRYRLRMTWLDDPEAGFVLAAYAAALIALFAFAGLTWQQVWRLRKRQRNQSEKTEV